MKPHALFAFLLLGLHTAAGTAAGTLEVHDAWVREAPPGVSVLAAYFTLHNHSQRTRTILGVSSPDFKQVEMHRSVMKDGMAGMKPVSRLILAPEGAIHFAPGGLQLMLITPKRELHSGDTVSLSLHFTDHTSLDFTATVQKNHAMSDQQPHSH